MNTHQHILIVLILKGFNRAIAAVMFTHTHYLQEDVEDLLVLWCLKASNSCRYKKENSTVCFPDFVYQLNNEINAFN